MIKIEVTQIKARSSKVVQEFKFQSEDRAWATYRALVDQLGSEFAVAVVGAAPRAPVGGTVPKIISKNVKKTVDINPWLAYSYNRN